MNTFYSISQYPGKTGTFYYNSFFKKYNIDAEYKALGVEPNSFENTINLLKTQAKGISVSMPYKNKVINYLDEKSLDVAVYSSCNTIVVQNENLIGYNTDIAGIMSAVESIKYYDKTIIIGNGSIGSMFYRYMKSLGYSKVLFVSRNLGNFEKRHESCDVLINCTSLGTVNSHSPVDTLHDDTRLVIDLSIKPNLLSEQAKAKNIQYFSGIDFYKHQFQKQFMIYTGLSINMDEINLLNPNDA
jgi:shikimate dehydrogenase